MRDDQVTLRLVRELAKAQGHSLASHEPLGEPTAKDNAEPADSLDSVALLEALIASDFDLFKAILRWGHDA